MEVMPCLARADVASCQSPGVHHMLDMVSATLQGGRQYFQKAKIQGKTLKQVGVIWKRFDG